MPKKVGFSIRRAVLLREMLKAAQNVRFKFRFRHVLLGFLVVFFLILLFDNYLAPKTDFSEMDARFVKFDNNFLGKDERYAINTPGCRIPEVDPFDPSIQNFTEKVPPFHCPCENGFGLTYVENDVLKVNFEVLIRFPIDIYKAEDLAQFYCCMWAMYRNEIEDDDNIMRFPSECIQFQKSIPVQTEYLKVECFLRDQRIHETFHINLIRKPEVEDRCEKTPQKCSVHENMGVLLLFLDSVSRINFRRSFPESRKVLIEELHAIEMHGYNRVGDNTFPNLVAMLSGMSEEELHMGCWKSDVDYFDDCDFLWKDFADAGFRTAFIEDFPNIGAFHYQKSGFRKQPTDYYGHNFLKEASKLMFHQRDCLNQMSETEIVFKWCHDFAKFFRNRKYFVLFATSRFTHHENISRAALADPLLKSTLRAMKYDGLLDNVFLFLFSDHGLRYGDFRETVSGSREVNLPAFYVVPPSSFAEQFPEAQRNLADNAHRLTTPYDLHETLRDILHCSFSPAEAESSPRRPDVAQRQMTSLFREIPDTRKCSEIGIPVPYCACFISETKLSHDIEVVQKSFRALIDQLNNITEPYRNLCAHFVPDYILSAREIQFLNSDSKVETYYEITFGIEPGPGMFQGLVTIGPDGGSLIALPEITRMDVYGSSSACIEHNSMLRKYCHCV